VAPGSGLVAVAEVARVRRSERRGGGGRGRPHRVIAARDAREVGLRHVAIDARCLALRLMAVRRPLLHARLVAGQAGLIRAGRLPETVTAARRVTVQTVELPRPRAGAAPPGGERVVLAE